MKSIIEEKFAAIRHPYDASSSYLLHSGMMEDLVELIEDIYHRQEEKIMFLQKNMDRVLARDGYNGRPAQYLQTKPASLERELAEANATIETQAYTIRNRVDSYGEGKMAQRLESEIDALMARIDELEVALVASRRNVEESFVVLARSRKISSDLRTDVRKYTEQLDACIETIEDRESELRVRRKEAVAFAQIAVIATEWSNAAPFWRADPVPLRKIYAIVDGHH